MSEEKNNNSAPLVEDMPDENVAVDENEGTPVEDALVEVAAVEENEGAPAEDALGEVAVADENEDASVDGAPAEEAGGEENGDNKWYAIHVLSGHERKIKAFLEKESEALGLADRIASVLIPSEEVTEMREGKKRVKNKTFFPGYMLLKMTLDKETQHLVLNTPGITNFVGPRNKPQPLRQEEIDRILGRVQESKTREIVSVPFRVGDPIRVNDGPFIDFTGFVEEINEEKKKAKVLVSIFGRSTPVELDFLQIELEK